MSKCIICGGFQGDMENIPTGQFFCRWLNPPNNSSSVAYKIVKTLHWFDTSIGWWVNLIMLIVFWISFGVLFDKCLGLLRN